MKAFTHIKYLFVILIFAISTYAQNWTSYFADIPVNDIVVDNDNVWLATNNIIQINRNTKASNTLSWNEYNKKVRFLRQSNDGKYIYAFGNGLVRYDGSIFINYSGFTYAYMYPAIPSNFTDMDVSNNGTIWISHDVGLYKYESPVVKSEINFVNDDYNQRIYNIKSLEIESDSILWFVNNEFLYRYKTFTGKCDKYAFGPLGNVYDLKQVSESVLLIAADKGLVKFDNGIFEIINWPEDSIAKSKINTIGANGNVIWLGTESGLIKIENGDWILYNTENSLLPFNSIIKIVFDNSTTWVLAQNGGIISINNDIMERVRTGNGELPSNNFRSISITKDNTIYLGSIDAGLLRIQDNTWVNFRKYNSILTSDIINSISIGQNGRLYLSTGGNSETSNSSTVGGIVVIDGEQWSLINKLNSPLTNNLVLKSFIDQKYHLWVSVKSHGIWKYDGTEWEHFTSQDLPHSFQRDVPEPLGVVYDILEDNSGIIWFACQYGILISYNEGEWNYYKPFSELTKTLNPDLRFLMIDEQNRIWISSEGEGVSVFDGEKYSIIDKSTTGLPSNTIRKIINDNNNVKWISTDRGLVKYESESIKIYTTENSEIIGNNIFDLAMTDNNELWILTTNGISIYSENEIDLVEDDFNSSVSGFSLGQNYPNPFNPVTKISYNIPSVGYVELKVFDINGREVAELINDFQNPGNHDVQFSAANLASGVYLYRLRYYNKILTKKLILLK